MKETNTNERASTQALKEMAMGETRTFWQEDAYGIESARALSSKCARLFGCKFSATADYVNNTITITKGL